MNKKTAAKKKSYKIQVCLTKAQRNRVEQIAKKQGMKIGPYLREMGLKKTPEKVMDNRVPDWVTTCEQMNQIYCLIEESNHPELLEQVRQILTKRKGVN